MILTRTPYRISFFGGGTDYHTYYEEHGGEVLSCSINHYNYISCRFFPPFHAEYRNRIVWNKLEYPDNIEDIEHNAVRAALLHHEIRQGVEISNQCDLPARSGLGSSSSFCAGLLKAIYALKGEMLSKYALAKETIYLERVLLKENVGIQDQIAAVYGGINHIIINHNASFAVEPVVMSDARRTEFNDHLLLFFTGVARTASEICKKQIETTKDKTQELKQMQALVPLARDILADSSKDLADFGKMLDESWQLKRSLTSDISTGLTDEIYDIARQHGALGGKVLGAGGGGFMLFFAKPENHLAIKKALRNLIHVPFKFDEQGSQTLLYNPKYYHPSTYEKRDFIHLQSVNDTMKVKA